METRLAPLTDLAALLADVVGQLRSMREQLQRIEGRLALLPIAAMPQSELVDRDDQHC